MLENALAQIKNRDIFLYTEPDILDFTNPNRPVKLHVVGSGLKVGIPLPHDFDSLTKVVAAWPYYFGQEKVITIGWGSKSLFTFVRVLTGGHLDIGRVYDLKAAESFLGIEKPRPESFQDAQARFSHVLTLPCEWPPFDLHSDLIQRVLPEMESEWLAHRGKGCRVFSCYEVEGQRNGRLKCTKAYRNAYVPHTLSERDKEMLYPPDPQELFLYFDYRSMEVMVLQWLSGDPVLGEILASGEDVYEGIWRRVTGREVKEAHRKLSKSLFLPIVYGQSVASVANKLGKTEKFAEELINKIRQTFSIGLEWVDNQKLGSDGKATDYFGRQRQFSSDEVHKIRNFVVQAPASIVCLKKLVQLSDNIGSVGRLVFNVHDGFCILTTKKNWKLAYQTCTSILESSCEPFLDLQLKTSCVGGRKLNSLARIG